jgi:filamentous hemagglutinin family protein
MKPKALLSLLAVTGAFLNAEITPAQTLPPSVRTPPADNADNNLGTQAAATNHNLTVAGGFDREQTLSHSFQDFSLQAGKVANVKTPVENRDIIARATESLFSAANGILNLQLANFLPINPSSLALGSNAQLNIGIAVATKTNNGAELADQQGQQYIANNPPSDAPLVTNTTGRVNPDRANIKNSPQSSTEANVSDPKSKANPSIPINESGTVGKSNQGNANVTPTGDISISGTLHQSTALISNDHQSSRSSDPVGGDKASAVPTAGLTPTAESSLLAEPKAQQKENRVDNAGKMAIDPQNQGKLSLDRSTIPTSVRKVDLIDVSLIVSNDILVKKDDLGDLKIYSTGTLGITNSSGISSTSFSQGKTGNISLATDRMLLNNAIIQTPSTGAKGGNIQITTLDRLLLKNLSEIPMNSSSTGKNGNKDNTALTAPTDRVSLACGVRIGENKFTVTGDGGLLSNHRDPLTSDVILSPDALGINSQPNNWLCDNQSP